MAPEGAAAAGAEGTLWQRAYGDVSLPPKGNDYPMPPAGAPHRAPGTIGPVAPTTLGLHQQAAASMLACGAFSKELYLTRKVQGKMALPRGDLVVGKLGHVVTPSGVRVRSP